MEIFNKLKSLLDDQQAKMLNRIFYSCAVLTFPLMVFIINILSLTSILKGNPIEVIILVFILVGIIFILLIENIVKNMIGYWSTKKLRFYLNDYQTYLIEINQFKTYLFLYSNLYKTINILLQTLTKNSNFVKTQNKSALKYLNWKWSSVTILFFVFGFTLLLSESLYWNGFDLTKWSIILGLIIAILGTIISLAWLIPRQINFNQRYHKFHHHQIEEYQYNFSKPYLLLRNISEKLEG